MNGRLLVVGLVAVIATLAFAGWYWVGHSNSASHGTYGFEVAAASPGNDTVKVVEPATFAALPRELQIAIHEAITNGTGSASLSAADGSRAMELLGFGKRPVGQSRDLIEVDGHVLEYIVVTQ
jgi:hypothetical protein